MIKNIRHTGIVVNDLESALYFYRDLLGFQIVKRMEESGDYLDKICGLANARVSTVKMSAIDGQLIELLHFYSHPSKVQSREISDPGITHIALTVDDLNSEYVRLSNAGVLFNSPPQLSPDGYAKVAFCCAPEGTLIELVEVLCHQ